MFWVALAECHKVAKSTKGKKNTDSSRSDIFNGIKVKKVCGVSKKEKEK